MQEVTVMTRPRARSFIIKRPRLTKLLDESEARILLLAAPAGYGKTTLAREWLEGKDDVAWYSGGPAMADVAALAAGIAEVLAPADDELSERVRNLAARSQSPEVLARAIAASDAAKHCTTLALDDCHHAAGSDEVTTFMSELFARTTFRLVATSRVRPAWVTPRMVVYGEAAIVESDELAFTDEEAREVLALSSRPRLRVVAEARGWPAVIGLAARHGGSGAPVRGLEPADLYEFFAEDIFETASTELRNGLFLLALGADAESAITIELLGASNEVVLAEAVERGFVATSLDPVALHPLLRGFLFSKLRAFPRAQTDESVRKVVAALATRARWDECLVSLEAFPVPDLILSILDQALVELLAAGRTTTIKRWLTLATTSGITDPTLLLAEAEVALREGDDRRAQVLGERAGDLLQLGDTAARAYLVAGRAAHLRDDRGIARAHCARSEQLATSVETKLQAQWAQFTSAVEEHGAELAEIVTRMRKLKDNRADSALRIQQAQGLLLFYTEGDAHAAAGEFELAAGLLPDVRDPVLRTSFLNLYSYAMLVVGRYDLALDLAGQQIEEAETNGVDFAVDHGLLRRASALIGVRSLRAAQQTIAELQHRSRTASDHVLRNTNLQAVRLRIALGDLDRAEILLRSGVNLLHGSWPERLAYHGLVLAARGNTQEGESELLSARETANSFDATAIADLGLAIVELQHADPTAERSARAALTQAIKKGRMDAVVTTCRTFPDLARIGATEPAIAQSLTELFMSSRDFDLGRRAGLHMPRELRRNEGLSSREREVYELLVQGRTNSEIAKSLFISESTAKVHVRHIYDKLGVHTRAEAALVAPEDI